MNQSFLRGCYAGPDYLLLNCTGWSKDASPRFGCWRSLPRGLARNGMRPMSRGLRSNLATFTCPGYPQKMQRCFAPWCSLAEPQKGQRGCGVHVRAGLPAPRRVNEGDGRQSHRQSDEPATNRTVWDELMDWRAGIFQQRGEYRGGNHEHPQCPSLDQILGPMLAQCGVESHLPGTVVVLSDWWFWSAGASEARRRFGSERTWLGVGLSASGVTNLDPKRRRRCALPSHSQGLAVSVIWNSVTRSG
jgi:hypothetical protein